MAQIKRVFLDANILFTAAHNPSGIAFSFIQKAELLKIEIFTSDYAYEEARYNLGLKFPEAVQVLENLKRYLHLIHVQVDEFHNPLKLPLDDLPIFQAASKSKSHFLISGDLKAFGKWMNQPERCENIILLTLREFIDSHVVPGNKKR